MTEAKKILPLKQLVNISRHLKKKGRKIVLCHGVFDLLHPGHVRYFRSAKKHGDILMVTLTGDKFVRKGPGRPVFNEDLRAEVLAALEIIDYVSIIYSDSAVDTIKLIKPDIYAKGPDYKRRKPKPSLPRKLGAEEEAVTQIGGKLIFTDDLTFSSSHIINKHLESYPESTKEYLQQFRETYNEEAIIDLLCSLKKKKILVIGDAIIDQYHYTLPLGKSSKEPVVVHIYRTEESFAGGILATANHVAALSDNVHLITLLGKKQSFEPFIRKHMVSNVILHFFHRRDGHTIIKRRFIDEVTNQKLFQISYMQDSSITDDTERKLAAFLRKEISGYDMVIVNDFGHGMLTSKIIGIIAQKAKYLALNVQTNSANYGFNVITKYPRADFACMDEQELRLATHDKFTSLEKLMQVISQQLKCKEIIVTRGASGSVSFTRNNGVVTSPALSQTVVDRVGAGDAFFAIASPCTFIGMNQALVSFIGNCAGALKVQTVGNKMPIDFKDLTKFITRLLK